MWNEFIQTIKGTQESRFSTSRRPDQGRNLSLSNMDINILEGVGGPIKEVKLSGFHFKGWIWRDHRDVCGWCGPFGFSCPKLSDYELGINRIPSPHSIRSAELTTKPSPPAYQQALNPAWCRAGRRSGRGRG
jgi:hypothetical protein